MAAAHSARLSAAEGRRFAFTLAGGFAVMRIAAPNGKIIEFHSARRSRGASLKRADW